MQKQFWAACGAVALTLATISQASASSIQIKLSGTITHLEDLGAVKVAPEKSPGESVEIYIKLSKPFPSGNKDFFNRAESYGPGSSFIYTEITGFDFRTQSVQSVTSSGLSRDFITVYDNSPFVAGLDGLTISDQFTTNSVLPSPLSACTGVQFCSRFNTGGPASPDSVWFDTESWANTAVPSDLPKTSLFISDNSLPRFYFQYYDGLGGADQTRDVSGSILLNSLSVAPVPLPAAGWMFLSALLGAATIMRRKKV